LRFVQKLHNHELAGMNKDMTFRVSYKNQEIVAKVSRPISTKFSLYLNGKIIAEASRPATTDLICGIKTLFGLKPKWEIVGYSAIDGQEHEIRAKHFTTFTRQYIEIYVDGELIGPEKN